MYGLNLDGKEIRLDAPDDNASDDQWLDWAALVGLFYANRGRPLDYWLQRSTTAYLDKWEPHGRSHRLCTDT
jgi:hypothetical protein